VSPAQAVNEAMMISLLTIFIRINWLIHADVFFAAS